MNLIFPHILNKTNIRLRNNPDERATAEQSTQTDNITLNLTDEKPKPREVVNAFLKWNKKPLRRDTLNGKTYEYNGILWAFLSDEELKRKVADFYESLDSDYTINKISKLAELITLRIDRLPQENPDYIGFKNGVLNKKTGEFMPHNSAHFIRYIDDFYCKTHSTKTPYFDDWLNFTANGNEDKRNAILAGLYMILSAFKQALPDALKEAGEKSEIIQLKTNGIIHTNIHWKDKDQTLNEWEN